MRNYGMSNDFLGLFAVFLMLGRLNARWTDVLIVLCESEGDTHAFKKEGSTWIILNHKWYIEYAALFLISFHVGWDTCYIRLLYSSSIEFWWQHFLINMQGFCPPRWSQGVGSRAHQGFSSRPQPVQEEQTMAEETQVTNVPNAALASDSLGGVWTCSMWAMMLDLEAFIPGMSRAKPASIAGDIFSRFPTWNSSRYDSEHLFLRISQLHKCETSSSRVSP